MEPTLVVVRPFGPYARGDAITDPEQVADLLAGEHALDVVRVLPTPAAPDANQAPRTPEEN